MRLIFSLTLSILLVLIIQSNKQWLYRIEDISSIVTPPISMGDFFAQGAEGQGVLFKWNSVPENKIFIKAQPMDDYKILDIDVDIGEEKINLKLDIEDIGNKSFVISDKYYLKNKFFTGKKHGGLAELTLNFDDLKSRRNLTLSVDFYLIDKENMLIVGNIKNFKVSISKFIINLKNNNPIIIDVKAEDRHLVVGQ